MCCVCLTCCHVDENALARPQIGHLKQHHVGGHVVDGDSSAFLKAHLLRHGECVVGGRDDHFLPHAVAAHHDDTIPHLREDGGRGGGRTDTVDLLRGSFGWSNKTLQQRKYVFLQLLSSCWHRVNIRKLEVGSPKLLKKHIFTLAIASFEVSGCQVSDFLQTQQSLNRILLVYNNDHFIFQSCKCLFFGLHFSIMVLWVKCSCLAGITLMATSFFSALACYHLLIRTNLMYV